MFQKDNGRSLSKALRVGLVVLALVASSQAFARGEGGGGGGGGAGGDGGGAEAGGNQTPNGNQPPRGHSSAPVLIFDGCPQLTNKGLSKLFC